MTLRTWPLNVAPAGTTLTGGTTGNVVATDGATATTVSPGAGNTIQSSSAQTHSGGLSAELVTGGTNSAQIRLPFVAADTLGAISFYRYVPNSLTARIAGIRHSSGTIFSLGISGSAKLQINNSSGTALATSTDSVVPNQWNRFEAVFDTTTGNVTARVFAGDSTTPYAATSVTGATLGSTAAAVTVDYGMLTNATGTAYFDSVQMDNGRTGEIGPYLPPTVTSGVWVTGTVAM